jgi:hypothetical protein
MPSNQQLNTDLEGENSKNNFNKGILNKQRKPRFMEQPVEKDLFGNIIENPGQRKNRDVIDLESDKGAGEEDVMKGLIGESDPLGEKSYTLTMICDPEESGIETRLKDYKSFLEEKEARGDYDGKSKRLVINS